MDWNRKVVLFDEIYEGVLEVPEHPRVMISKGEVSHYKLVVPESLSNFVVRKDDSSGHQEVKGLIDFDEMLRSLIGKHIKVWISFNTFWRGTLHIRDGDITYDSDRSFQVNTFELSEEKLGG